MGPVVMAVRLRHVGADGVVRFLVLLVWTGAAACLLDALRRSRTEWAYLDRRRGGWVAALIVGGLLVAPAGVVVPAYLVAVVRRARPIGPVTAGGRR